MKKEDKEKLSVHETVIAVSKIKQFFERQLCTRLDLIKVSSPIFINSDKGIQDQLSGVEKAVSFVKGDDTFEVIHSLAKWKRMALKKYSFEGICTDMIAIRKDDIIDDIHSLYVDQWDWEKVISRADRSKETLKEVVTRIYKAIRKTSEYIRKAYPVLSTKLPKTVFFISSQDLEDMYPNISPSEREYLITKERGVVFIIGIGDKLKSGIIHDTRSPDYDDWSLDGDLLIWDKHRCRPMEITSMGIRVDKETLISQLEKSGTTDRMKHEYHQAIIKEELPYTIGGGIGQSRLCMLLLEKEHIAEVQASSWPEEVIQCMEAKEIRYL